MARVCHFTLTLILLLAASVRCETVEALELAQLKDSVEELKNIIEVCPVCGTCSTKPTSGPTAVGSEPTPEPSTTTTHSTQPYTAEPTTEPAEPTPKPTTNPTSSTTTLTPTTTRCGVASCTLEVWATAAGEYPCGSRILWVVANLGKSEEDACYQVAYEEFPVECGGCAPAYPTPRPTASPLPTASPRPTSVTYKPGELTVSENGLLLSTGLSSKVVARTGDRMPGGEIFHGAPDAGACFAHPSDGGWAYVSNSEVGGGAGGVGSIKFNAAGDVESYQRVLTGTSRNCGGRPASFLFGVSDGRGHSRRRRQDAVEHLALVRRERQRSRLGSGPLRSYEGPPDEPRRRRLELRVRSLRRAKRTQLLHDRRQGRRPAHAIRARRPVAEWHLRLGRVRVPDSLKRWQRRIVLLDAESRRRRGDGRFDLPVCRGHRRQL